MFMMIPEYMLIAEILLFSYVFTKGRALRQKMLATFKLSSEYMSSRDRYDFGMRAEKTTLKAAAMLKREADAKGTQDELVLWAPKDSNVPKFLNEDFLLFDGIVGNLFPGILTPISDYRYITRALVDTAHEYELQLVDALWIENMNTVLDGNKKLCLPNREVIIFTPNMRIMFKVADLLQA
jgi:dynein heavy chain